MKGLDIQDLSVGYNKKVLLKDISIACKMGEIITLSADNGKGKSSLLYTLIGLIPSINGKISLGQNRLDLMKANERKNWISMVFSSSGNRAIIKVEDALKLGNEQFFASNEHKVEVEMEKIGLLHLLGKPLNELSDGQYQKVMIARVLLHDTPIVLMDEPTSFLDYQNKTWLYKTIVKMCEKKNKTFIIATHDLDMIASYESRRIELSNYIN